jgi:4-carboxymuconolactone decarboxylase
MSRLPELTPDNMTEAQRLVAEQIASGPRGSVRGPFPWLLRSPGIAAHVQRLGAYIRYESALPGNLRELAILVTARFWRAQYEWFAHKPLALEEGVAEAVVDAMAESRRPEFSDDAEALVYDFCTAMLETHEVSDAAYEAALAGLGEEGLVDLISLLGYYSLLAMVMATFQIPVPGGEVPLKG